MGAGYNKHNRITKATEQQLTKDSSPDSNLSSGIEIVLTTHPQPRLVVKI